MGVIAVALTKDIRLIARPRSYRVQKTGMVGRWERRIKVGIVKGWVDLQRLPRSSEDNPEEFTAAVNMFQRRVLEKNHAVDKQTTDA